MRRYINSTGKRILTAAPSFPSLSAFNPCTRALCLLHVEFGAVQNCENLVESQKMLQTLSTTSVWYSSAKSVSIRPRTSPLNFMCTGSTSCLYLSGFFFTVQVLAVTHNGRGASRVFRVEPQKQGFPQSRVQILTEKHF